MSKNELWAYFLRNISDTFYEIVKKICNIQNDVKSFVGLSWRERVPLILLISIIGYVSVAVAEYCWLYEEGAATNPKTWLCSFSNPPSGAPAGDPSQQNLRDQHFNWHCTNGPIGGSLATAATIFGTEEYGRAFLGFHKQIIYDFDLYREQFLSLDRIEIWDVNSITNPADPNYNPMPYGMPGSQVTAAQANAIVGGPGSSGCLVGQGRAANTPCPTCDALPLQFRHPSVGGTLNTFTTGGAVGWNLDNGWHGAWHGDIANTADANGYSCDDINPPSSSSRDPMFWRAHAMTDEVHQVWQTLQATDIMVVLDKSGSMSEPASSSGGAGTKFDAAKDAVRLFADLVQDGQGHNLGLVSFSSSAPASPELGLTSVDGIAPTVDTSLAGISAGGSTSIGAGLLAAQQELTNNGSHERQAILLLTDGQENTPPCLDGTGFGCLGPGSDVAANAFGDTQVCIVGFGEEANLDSIVLRNLAERQTGFFTAFDDLTTNSELKLKKFFGQCFSNIFDEVVATDPIFTLPPDRIASDPITVNVTKMDSQITFLLAWQQPQYPLRLNITTPSGATVDISDPLIESSSRHTWEFARIPLPYNGESGGQWQVQAVRTQDGGRVDDIVFTQFDTRRSNTYFIDALVTGPARLMPENPHFNYYTTDPLKAVLRIPESHRPIGEFDNVEVEVTVTSPTVGTGNILAERGIGNSTTVSGDNVSARTATLKAIGQSIVPTQTKTYKLYDDGTHGDAHANNHYWSAELTDLGRVEGNYHYHYVATITHNNETLQREADQTIFVEVKIDPEKTTTSIEDLGAINGRQNTKYTFVPMDTAGNLLGPGRQDFFELETSGDARIEGEVRDNGKGGYEVTVSWTEDQGPPNLTLTQNGQPRQVVLLPEGEVQPAGPPAIHDHKEDPIDPSYTVPCGPSRITVVADTNRIYCIDYSISGGMVRGATLDTAEKTLVLPIHPMATNMSSIQPVGMDNNEEGFITLDIPRTLLDSREGDEDGRFTIMRNEEPADYEEEETTPETRRITIMLPENTSDVRVMGTSVIPEFSSLTILVLAATVTLMIALTTMAVRRKIKF